MQMLAAVIGFVVDLFQQMKNLSFILKITFSSS